MNYLGQRHTQILLVSFVVVSVLLFLFSKVDIAIAGLFYHDGFYLKGAWWENVLYHSVSYFLKITVFGALGIYIINKIMKKSYLSLDGRKVLFLVTVLMLGSGIIVNTVLKDNSGRPRPRDVVEFSGEKQFQPPFVFSNQCDKNCSFSSGHSAAAFFALALAMLFKYRRTALAIAFVYGSLVSLARVVAGGHFFSDVVVSFFIMAIMTDLFYWLLISRYKLVSED